MKNLTAKQEARHEKKKKKIAALAQIIKLNDHDRRKRTPPPTSTAKPNNNHNNHSTTSTDKDAGTSSDSGKRPADAGGADTPADRPTSRDSRSSNCSSESTASSSSSSTTAEPSIKRLKRSTNTAEQPTRAPSSSNSADTPAPISSLDYAAMKRTVNTRKRADRSVPKIRLKLMGDCALLSNSIDNRTPIFLTDVQHLVMATVLGSTSPCSPHRWCHIERSAKVPHVIVLVVEGCSLYDYTANESVFEFSGRRLTNKLEVVMPADGHIVEELVQVPLTDGQSAELIDKYGSLEAAIESTRNQMLHVQTVFPIANKAGGSPTTTTATKRLADETTETPGGGGGVEKVPRTQLLLSALQMVDEGYPIPLSGELANRYKNFVMTRDAYAPVTDRSPMFGLDCEMCRTTAGVNEMTRISIVNEQYESVYETLVRPENKIVDYLTKYSGITGAMMLNVTKTRREVQQEVRALLPADAILVGQSLQSDLFAMQMMHPYVIDTSCIFNLSGERRMKSKLQALTLEFLGEVIQHNPLGHDSIEDCSSSLKLARLKMERGIDFGDAILSGRKRANEVQRQREREGTNNGAATDEKTTTTTETTDGGPAAKRRKSTVVISSAETGVDYSAFVSAAAGLAKHSKHIQCEQTDSNKSAVRRTQELAIQHDLTICHVRLAGEKLREADAAKRTLSKVDKWIAKCWESLAPNGLLIVLLGAGSAGGAEPGVGAATQANGGGDDGGGGDAAKLPVSSHSGVVMFDIKPSSSSVDCRQ